MTLIAYVLIIMAIGAFTALQGAIVAGQVPIPADWAWLTPVLTALLAALTTRLRQLGPPEA
jgi:hypothetical protein